jgi:tetratricopeptide (TPR) repeat protein
VNLQDDASTDGATADKASRRARWLIAAALVLGTFAAYFNCLPAPFVFDDIPAIVQNSTIERLWPLSVPLSPPGEGQTVTARPLLNLSFAINFAFSGRDVRAYHLTNIAIHAIGALLVFGLVRRTLSGPALRERFGDPRTRLALAGSIAALWALHPLQTQSVTYIVQRAESLMGLFYLLTLYALARAASGNPLVYPSASRSGNLLGYPKAEAPDVTPAGGARNPERVGRASAGWLAVSWLACLLGMATKEVMVSAPVIALLYDRFFLLPDWRAIWRARGRYYVALAATWLLLICLVIAGGGRGGTSGFGSGAKWPAFLATQPGAIFTYLRLTFWPSPLILDYGGEWVTSAMEVVGPALLLLAIAIATLLALWRQRPGAFLGLWFFAILAPTSLTPGVRQTMAENRMYLALIPVIACVVLGLHRWLGRRGVLLWATAAVALGAVTVNRNTDYLSASRIWTDTVRKRPHNPWARVNYGNVLAEAGHPNEALEQFTLAVQWNPTDAVAHYDLGNVLVELHRLDEAIAQFEQALRINPHYTAALINLADALYRTGHFEQAAARYRDLIAAGSDTPEMHYNLGNALIHAGRGDEAVTELSTALQRRPDYSEAAYNLGSYFLQAERPEEAVPLLERAVELKSEDADSRCSLASALAQIGRVSDGVRHAREAVRLAPKNARAHYTLSQLYLFLDWRDAALEQLDETLALDPNNAVVRETIGRLRGAAR